MKPKVVFDTNIYISAIIFGANPRTCLELARTGQIELFSSRAILFELTQKLTKKFGWEDNGVADIVEGLSKFVQIISPTVKVSAIKKDQSDNKILECAKEAKADFIVSGDKKHILPLKKFEKAIILNSNDFLKSFYN